MPDYPPSNFQQLRPSRTGLTPGDIFTMRIADGRYLFGRVVRTDAHCFGPGCILVYVFRYMSHEPVLPPRLLVSDLLIPPATVNRLGWPRGSFMTVGRRPFEDRERFPVHYFDDAPRRRRWGSGILSTRTASQSADHRAGLPWERLGSGTTGRLRTTCLAPWGYRCRHTDSVDTRAVRRKASARRHSQGSSDIRGH